LSADFGEQVNRAQQQDAPAQPTASTKKVYTNEDMPKASSSSATDDAKARKAEITSQVLSDGSAATKKTKGRDSVEQLKAKIRKQQELIAALQQAIKEIEPRIGFVQNNRNIYTNAPEYNAAQKERQLELQHMKSQLEDAKSTLTDLQEEARQAGFGNALYE